MEATAVYCKIFPKFGTQLYTTRSFQHLIVTESFQNFEPQLYTTRSFQHLIVTESFQNFEPQLYTRLVSLSLESGQPGTNCNRNTIGFILNLNVSSITYQKLQGLSFGEVRFFTPRNWTISINQNFKEYEYI